MARGAVASLVGICCYSLIHILCHSLISVVVRNDPLLMLVRLLNEKVSTQRMHTSQKSCSERPAVVVYYLSADFGTPFYVYKYDL